MLQQSNNILIIDDSETDAAIMREALKSVVVGNTIRTLNNATDAIDLLNKKGNFNDAIRPDLIILDLKMPNFDGFEFLRIVKKDPRFLYIPIIVLSGTTQKKEILEAYKLGANCCIQKPDNIKKFKQVVEVINEFWLGITELPKQ